MESARVGAADADGADPAGPEGAILGPADLAGPDPARLPDDERPYGEYGALALIRNPGR